MARPMDPSPLKKKKKRRISFGGAFDIKNQAGGLAELIEKQANSQKRSAEKKMDMPAQVDPFTALQDQLFSEMNNINVEATPIEQLRKMASSQVDAQFNPMIDALQRQMETKTKRGERSKGEARKMYGSLAKDLVGQIPELTRQFAEAEKNTDARYDQAQNVLKEEYGEQSKEQDALLRRLGVQAASQEASEQSRDDQKYFQGQLELDQKAANDNLEQQEQSATSYQRALGGNSKMAGENRAQEIGQMLEDYLTEAGGQMSGLQAQRKSALAALIQQMQAQDQQRVAQQEDQASDRLMDMYRFQLDAMNSASRNAARSGGTGGGGTFKGTSGLSGASNYLAEQYPDSPIKASHLMEQINDVLSNKNVVRGKFQLDKGDASLGKGPTYSKVGQEYMIDLLRREFERSGSRYGTQDLNNTINALMAYMGKLR